MIDSYSILEKALIGGEDHKKGTFDKCLFLRRELVFKVVWHIPIQKNKRYKYDHSHL